MLLDDNYELLQENTISILKNYPRFLTILKAIAGCFNNAQEGFNYLCENTSLNTAEGIWLDYIGWLVGQIRSEYIDTDRYFCVNQTGVDENDNPIGDVNASKFFYFPNSIISGNDNTNLSDGVFKNQIIAKIAYNVSGGTREDLIKIIKPLVNANNVIIQKVYSDGELVPMVLKITLFGEDILTNNIVERILSVLPDGVGLYENDVIIYNSISYDDIERRINEIVEMTNIGGVPSGYGYVQIDEDLDEILEI